VNNLLITTIMHDTYTHTESCTQSFKDHLRTHIASRKQSLGSGNTFINRTPSLPVNSNMSSAETLKPIEAPTCVCGLPVKDESERLWSGEVEKVAGETMPANGPFCECKNRVTVIDKGPAPEEKKKRSFKTKALDLLCSACTGYVAKPRAGGFYPDQE
jgi:hypothetical protein